MVKDEEAVYLKEQELSFLLGILTACKLSMADVALINLHKTHTNYNLLREQFAAEKILLFGVKPSQIDMPLDFPQYQLQKYNGQVYMCAPALAHLMEDRIEKTKLWNMLKQLFGLA
ncbi:MAG: hypothetical protein IPP48_16315 [Chitinophagaceae bacterium]|nr:hypothetical protein [Chitinophagaceae bacterium]